MSPIITIAQLYMQARTGAIDIPILKEVVPYLLHSASISGKSLAGVLDVKRSALSNAILLLTGVTLNDMLKEWRLLHAMYLLRNTPLSYEQIAAQCGFLSMRGFSKFIDANLHCTPYEYRQSRSHGNRK